MRQIHRHAHLPSVSFANGSITVADSVGTCTCRRVDYHRRRTDAQRHFHDRLDRQHRRLRGDHHHQRRHHPYKIVNAHGLPFTPVVNGNTLLFTGSGSGGIYANGVITLRI